jgi:hypothetical protein
LVGRPSRCPGFPPRKSSTSAPGEPIDERVGFEIPDPDGLVQGFRDDTSSVGAHRHGGHRMLARGVLVTIAPSPNSGPCSATFVERPGLSAYRADPITIVTQLLLLQRLLADGTKKRNGVGPFPFLTYCLDTAMLCVSNWWSEPGVFSPSWINARWDNLGSILLISRVVSATDDLTNSVSAKRSCNAARPIYVVVCNNGGSRFGRRRSGPYCDQMDGY